MDRLEYTKSMIDRSIRILHGMKKECETSPSIALALSKGLMDKVQQLHDRFEDEVIEIAVTKFIEANK